MRIQENIARVGAAKYSFNRPNKEYLAKDCAQNTSETKFSAYPSGNLLKAYYFSNQKNNKIAFRGAPWKLNLSAIGVPVYGDLTAEQAIKAFAQLRIGNYLDIGEDKFSYYTNKAIRNENLSFLERVTVPSEQKKFVEYYKNLTGFPNLAETSKRIKQEFVNAITAATDILNRRFYTDKFNIVQAGYDGVCSVGRQKALPGSDIDKAYVIIKGGNSYEAEELVNQFKGQIWENTDQRILSYNHDDAAFPQVYTKDQLTELLKAADAQVFPIARALRDYYYPQFTFGGVFIGSGSQYYINKLSKHFLDLQTAYNPDYIKANEFYIKLCKNFPKRNSDRIDLVSPSRENIKNIGFVLESMREGEVLVGERLYFNSPTYNFTNLSQLKALKTRGDVKPKRVSREKLIKEFDSWDTHKQYRFIKTLIHGSCANNTDFTTEFSEYFSKSGNDPFAPLINALMG